MSAKKTATPARKAKRARELNVVWCAHCGTKQPKLYIETLPEGGMPACPKCGLRPVSLRALLLAAGVTSDDYNDCPTCKAPNGNNQFCFGCGTALG